MLQRRHVAEAPDDEAQGQDHPAASDAPRENSENCTVTAVTADSGGEQALPPRVFGDGFGDEAVSHRVREADDPGHALDMPVGRAPVMVTGHQRPEDEDARCGPEPFVESESGPRC